MTHAKISTYDFVDKLGEYENQDAIGISTGPDFDLFSMSDGAGGIGIYCKEWADHLVRNQPFAPIKDQAEAIQWFNKISKLFHDTMLETLPLDDDFIREKFYGEGSYATVLYSWINKEKSQLYFSGIGDTTIFHFVNKVSGIDISLIEPINKQASLYDNPDLLNWKQPLNYQFNSKQVEVGTGDCILICTDSLSRRIIYELLLLSPLQAAACVGETITKNLRRDFLEHLKLNQEWFTVTEYINYLRETIYKDIDSFRSELQKWIDRNELEKDDYSFIIIDL